MKKFKVNESKEKEINAAKVDRQPHVYSSYTQKKSRLAKLTLYLCIKNRQRIERCKLLSCLFMQCKIVGQAKVP